MFAAKDTLLTRPSGGYQISRSLRFNSADSAYLNRTPASASNQKTWTWSGWVKRSTLNTYQYLFAAGTSNPWFGLLFSSNGSNNLIQVTFTAGTSGGTNTTAEFRDSSAWYHIVLGVDTTQATNTNRVKLYVNGVQITAFSATNYPSQNTDTQVNSADRHTIGSQSRTLGEYLDGYQTECYFIDGQALTPSSFGETDTQTGVWKPKAYSGSYGTNGFYLNFSDNSNTTAATLGKDYSGNGNNWTPNNFSVTAGAGNDSLVDSPTSYGTDTGAGGSVRGNYCTMNPLDKNTGVTLSNGNLDATSSGGWYNSRSTFGMTAGKWYWEITITSGLYLFNGITTSSATLGNFIGSDAYGWGYYSNSGVKYNSGTSSAYGASYTTNDVIGISFDADAGTLVFYKNGTSQGTAFTGLTSGPYFPTISLDTSVSMTANFGQRPFAYTAPSGFKALCTQNLPTPTIGATTATQAGKYFNTVLYTGTGSSLGVTGVGFQPDWVWVKGRSGATDHGIYDAVRGVQKQLESNTTTAETTETTGLTAFGSDGFTTGALAQLNTSSATYVAWNWKANGSGSSNPSGILKSQVSANTTAGFSVCTYTAPASSQANSFGHGLGVAPSMVLAKNRSSGTGGLGWAVYHSSLGANQLLSLNTTAAAATVSGYWGSGMTSTVVGLPTGASSTGFDNCTGNMVAYCFAEVAGYSKFGSYIGTGSLDSPFVYCGFRPAFVMIKNASVTQPWNIQDDARSTSNVVDNYLRPNTSDAEAYGYAKMDFVSNGFKIRDSDAFVNGNGNTMIFMAFAENPFKYSLARQDSICSH